MKIVAISDTHGQHRELEVPEADLLIHAGDFTRRGHLSEASEFAEWLAGLPHRHKVVIAGNHDWCFQETPTEARELLSGVSYLEDSCVVVEGFKIYGSPWQPWFLSWAFNLERGPELQEKWAMIPEDVDILLTHGPPYGIGDRTSGGEVVGCKDLLDRIQHIKPKFHFCGHIHEGAGVRVRDETKFINASSVDANYRILGSPVVIEI